MFRKILILILISLAITPLKISYSADFNLPHVFNPGEVLSANTLNELFSAFQSISKSVTENDLVGSWECTSTIDAGNWGSPGRQAGWQLDSESLIMTLADVELDFNADGDGTFSLESSSPNPFNAFHSEAANSAFRVVAGMIYFSTRPDFGPTTYNVKLVSLSRLEMVPLDSAEVLTSLICDKQDLPPSNPSDLTATLNNTTVSLSWTDNSSDETGFKILRRDSLSGEFEEVGTAAENATSTTNTLSTDGKYWYRIVATNANGDSLGSNVVKVTLGDEDDTQSLRNELRMMKERMELIEGELNGTTQ